MKSMSIAIAASCVVAVLAGCQSSPPRTMPAGGIAGYLCCNLHPSGNWVNDINYNDGSYPTLVVGTPVKATGYGNSRVFLDVGGRPYTLGNDHSRRLDMDTYTRRYIVRDDPSAAIDAMPVREREAIRSSRITLGMTQRQVAMALGYPIDTRDVEALATSWTYYTSAGVDYRVEFDAAGRVRELVAGSAIRRLVLAD